jgi:2-polyprenyl-6-methoxyphenol hydroxylase-like FAD-dependent oxidoreductase
MKAIIIGAGIGGLTAAIALRRAGVEAVVYERANDVQAVQVGGGIHLWHNGMRGLQRAGLAEQVEALGGRDAAVETAEFSTASGRRLGTWPLGTLERKLGAPTVGVARPELHRVIIDALDADALRLGSPCEGFVEQGGSAVACFAGGREERADVLIGADGIRSVVRAQLHGDEEPEFAGYASWQGFAEFEDDHAPPGLFRVVFGRGARFLHYWLGPNRMYWEGIFATTPGGGDPDGGRKDAVLARFSGWREPIEAIVAATPAEAINRADIYHRKPLKTWGAGRVTLLGDAAHPMTNALGQGGNQAIEDALVLTSRLTAADDAAAGLRAYERSRIGRTATIVRLSSFMTALSRLDNPAAVAARNVYLRVSLSTVAYQKIKRDMAYDFGPEPSSPSS